METLFYYVPALESVRDFMELGGTVLIAIAVLTLLMWSLIFERIFFMRARYPSMVRKAMKIWEGRPERKSWHAHRVREELISVVGQSLDQNLALLKTCVALCPLLGLLGTVTGMISVFEVMAISGSGNPPVYGSRCFDGNGSNNGGHGCGPVRTRHERMAGR